MKFNIVKASDEYFKEKREIKDMKDLMKLTKEHKGWQGKDDPPDLIIMWNGYPDANAKGPTVLIYDDWIE